MDIFVCETTSFATLADTDSGTDTTRQSVNGFLTSEPISAVV